MPSKSPAQARLMAAAAHTPGGFGGVPQKVGRDFNQADRGSKLLSRANSKRGYAQGGAVMKGISTEVEDRQDPDSRISEKRAKSDRMVFDTDGLTADRNERSERHLPGDLAQRAQRFDPAPSRTMTGQREDDAPALRRGGRVRKRLADGGLATEISGSEFPAADAPVRPITEAPAVRRAMQPSGAQPTTNQSEGQRRLLGRLSTGIRG